ncbi:hypothetical protein AB1Y20_015609 [Prymnesium parvum]|uniref:EGF-like domain-containing protein n=1 Tax=Prymnesium parvum TaxID=97485 RepID=A0AB34K0X8_PRYPA
MQCRGLGAALAAALLVWYLSSLWRWRRGVHVSPTLAPRADTSLQHVLDDVRAQSDSVRRLIEQSESANRELTRQLGRLGRGANGSASAPTDSGVPRPSASPPTACPKGCEVYGNCNELSGECACPFTREGAACDQPTMPDCATGGGPADGSEVDAFVNLAGLAGEQFWWNLRDIRNDGKDWRRRSPPYRWVGMVTCRCVEQAVSRLSLLLSPMPPVYPSYIGHSELALQHLVCVDAPGQTTAELWASGGSSTGVRWASRPVVAWLKSFPAHAPMLLPLHLVNERDFVRPAHPHLMYLTPYMLQRARTYAQASLRLRSGEPQSSVVLGEAGGELTAGLCASGHAAHSPSLLLVSWCARWTGRWQAAEQQPSCYCLSYWEADSHSMRQKAAHWRGPTVETGGAAVCKPPGAARVRRYLARLGTGPRGYPHVDELQRLDRVLFHLGPDMWRTSHLTHLRTKLCPNECTGRGSCAYGYCHCDRGFWGLDCGMSAERAALQRTLTHRPRVYVYEVPVALRRSCGPWRLSEELGDTLLASDYLEPDPQRADLFWIYGCPNGDTVMPMLAWIKRHRPYWNASVRMGVPRHVMVVGHEEGWSEVWSSLGRWLNGPGLDHDNMAHTWDDLHPSSPSRQLASLQLSGNSDYLVSGARVRGVSRRSPCRICFQPDKDVMIPGFPGIMDYPDDVPSLSIYDVQPHGRKSDCDRLARAKAYLPSGVPAPRKNSPKVFFSGAVQTKTHGPGLYEPSRLVFYSCWKNRSTENDFFIRQTESVLISVNSWEVEKPVDPVRYTRQASFCIVPEGKIGSYGHRMIAAVQLGCVPIFTKERYSYPFFHHAINWSMISVHVPPDQMPHLPQILANTDVEKLRAAMSNVRRRLLWTGLYGACHLQAEEGGKYDAFDTLLQELKTPRKHFKLTLDHKGPAAPERLYELNDWLRQRNGDFCTHGYRCIDQFKRSCAEQL